MGNLVFNGDFEEGRTAWYDPDQEIVNYDFVAWHSGRWGAWIGDLSSVRSIREIVSIPPGVTHGRLGYWYQFKGSETLAYYDYFRVRVKAGPWVLFDRRYDAPAAYVSNWTHVEQSVVLPPARDIEISFEVRNDVSEESWVLVDDVTVDIGSTIATPTATPVSTSGPGAVVVLSNMAFTSTTGALYVVGELVNRTQRNIEYANAEVTLRGQRGYPLVTEPGFAFVSVLAPDQVSPFSALFARPPNWSSYTFGPDWLVTDRSSYSLEVLDQTSGFDQLGWFRVSGYARNPYSATVRFAEAMVTMYGPEGGVVGVGYSYLNPYDLAPGETGSFDVRIYNWAGYPDQSRYARYALQVVAQ